MFVHDHGQDIFYIPSNIVALSRTAPQTVREKKAASQGRRYLAMGGGTTKIQPEKQPANQLTNTNIYITYNKTKQQTQTKKKKTKTKPHK